MRLFVGALSSAITALFLIVGCTGSPPVSEAVGEFQQHSSAGWGLVMPEGWQAHSSSTGMSLVRRTPYEGGYPTLNIRRLGEDEVSHYPIEGKRTTGPSGEMTYHYQKWRNALGRGFRLEGVLRTPEGVVFFVDASIWDSAPRVNRSMFQEQFWPVINSVRITTL